MVASPTSRSLQRARSFGWDAGVVEKWIPQTKRRHDLFGFVDIVALDGKPGVLAIQATSGEGGNMAARIAKARAIPQARRWLEAGNRIEFWGWAKRGAVGKRKLWTLRRVGMTLDDALELSTLELGEAP